jgi:hypothetical protein
MKYLIPLILVSTTLQAAEIESVEIGTNTMLVIGEGLGNVKRATLAREPIGVIPVTDQYLVVYCDCKRWPIGMQRLRLFKPHRKLTADVTITGQESDNQPPTLPNERPEPAG